MIGNYHHKPSYLIKIPAILKRVAVKKYHLAPEWFVIKDLNHYVNIHYPTAILIYFLYFSFD